MHGKGFRASWRTGRDVDPPPPGRRPHRAGKNTRHNQHNAPNRPYSHKTLYTRQKLNSVWYPVNSTSAPLFVPVVLPQASGVTLGSSRRICVAAAA